MSEQLPEIAVPDAASRFNVPSGAGFVSWFSALRESTNVLGIEILGRVGTKIGEEIVSRRLINGSDRRIPQEYLDDGSYARGWVDEGNRLALGIRPTGEVHAPMLETSRLNSVDYVQASEEITGYSRVWIDTEGRVALGVRSDGSVDIPQLNGSPSTPGEVGSDVSGPAIWCIGDSMTQGAGSGSSSATYPAVLANITNRQVYNSGVGGENSVTITARTGATPMIVTVDGGAIPSSGAVGLSLRPVNGYTPAPLLQGGVDQPYATGTLAGVPGKISRNSSTGAYSFTRTESGDPVTAGRPTPWLDSFSPLRLGDIAIIWIGQNGPNTDRAISDAQAIIGHLRASQVRALVIPRPTSTPADDAAFHAAFGRRAVLIREYLVEYGLEDAGITPTTQDETDIADGVIPSSLRVDSVHWTADAYRILAEQLAARIKELDW